MQELPFEGFVDEERAELKYKKTDFYKDLKICGDIQKRVDGKKVKFKVFSEVPKLIILSVDSISSVVRSEAEAKKSKVRTSIKF